MNVPNNKITGRNLLEILYRALNAYTKAIDDTTTGWDFMILCYDQVAKILDWITKTDRGWHTEEVDRSVTTYALSAYSEYRGLDEIVDQEVA